MLEKLVHSDRVLPPNQHYIRITIPNRVSYEICQTATHPGWDAKSESICKVFVEGWYEKRGSALTRAVDPGPVRTKHFHQPASSRRIEDYPRDRRLAINTKNGLTSSMRDRFVVLNV